MAPADRGKIVAKQLAERKAIRADILRLSHLRDTDIAAQRQRQSKSSGMESFDVAVLKALRQQIARKGIRLRQ
jgi:hypothetical protein